MILLSTYIYFFVPILMIMAFTPQYNVSGKKIPTIISLLFTLCLIALILIFRDVNAPSDMVNYSWMYHEQQSVDDIFKSYHGNYFFSFLLYIGNKLNLSQDVFFILLSMFYFFFYYLGLKLIFVEERHYLLALSLFAITSSFVLLFTNVIRQGLAFSLLVLAVGLYLNRYKFRSYLIMILAVFSHFSVLPIILFIFIANYVSKLKLKYGIIILLMLFLPILGQALLSSIASLGGLFTKIESFSEKDYNNKLVYIKIFIMYLFSLVLYLYGVKYKNFNNDKYRFLVNLYLLILSLILFTLPVLLLSSRYLYFTSGLMPILFSYLFYSEYNILNFKQRFILFVSGAIIYGLGIYNFPSVKTQLGI